MNRAIEPEWYGLGLMGSPTDLYVSNETQKISLAGNDWKLMPSFSEPYTFAHLSNNVGVSIYNAMIAPLVPYSIGVHCGIRVSQMRVELINIDKLFL